MNEIIKAEENYLDKYPNHTSRFFKLGQGFRNIYIEISADYLTCYKYDLNLKKELHGNTDNSEIYKDCIQEYIKNGMWTPVSFKKVFVDVVNNIGRPTFYMSSQNYKCIIDSQTVPFGRKCGSVKDLILNIRKIYPFLISYSFSTDDHFTLSGNTEIKCFPENYYTLNIQHINFCYMEDVMQKENTVISKDEPLKVEKINCLPYSKEWLDIAARLVLQDANIKPCTHCNFPVIFGKKCVNCHKEQYGQHK